MATFKCPYAKLVPLQCDRLYAFKQFYNDLKHAYESGKTALFCTWDSEFECHADPETCPRYVKHMIANIQKYTHR